MIASGCSYTIGNSWADATAKLLNCPLQNYAVSATGNGRISRSILYGVSEALKTYKPEEIFVGVAWSGNNRREVYQTKVDYENICLTRRIENPTGFVKGSNNWVTISPHWSDLYSEYYYKYFYDKTESEILTLEHIHRTQMFLDKVGIDYVMTTYAPGVLPETLNSSTEHLYNSIDFTKFLPVKSIMEWCIEESDLPLAEEDVGKMPEAMHPTPQHSFRFSQKVIYPYLKELLYERRSS